MRNKRNTEAVEIAPNTMVSGRVLQYAAAHQLPLAEVKTRVRDRVAAVQAAALARKLGEERLTALRAAPDTALTEPVLLVSRAQPREVQSTVLDSVLKAPVATLPAFVGIDLGEQGYAVAKVSKVLGRDPVAADASHGQTQYAQAWGDAESQAYYGALKARFKVEIKTDALKTAEQAASAASAAPN